MGGALLTFETVQGLREAEMHLRLPGLASRCSREVQSAFGSRGSPSMERVNSPPSARPARLPTCLQRQLQGLRSFIRAQQPRDPLSSSAPGTCFRKAPQLRSLPLGVRSTIRTRRSLALSTRLTRPFSYERRSTAVLIEPEGQIHDRAYRIDKAKALCAAVPAILPKSEELSPVSSIPAAAYFVRARIAFIITSQTWSVP